MEEQKSFDIKPWMWISILVAALLLVFSFDPIGDGLEKLFGKGADKWAINIIFISIIIYFIFFGKKKK